ncbi:hypothetical protein NDU88_004926 [Pleurodeles waltl]|uniref:Uncharacterized protein n=1 Tax=Pleurodeles waltl TaxID=8319 RepID=A0AAV7QJR9_PLEWA|nr:hypothetical protein NDU88_004926 [Pleurodeles waltl]
MVTSSEGLTNFKEVKYAAFQNEDCSRAPERLAILSSGKRDRRYPRGTAWDNPEGEDGGNPEIWVHSETKDRHQRRPVSEAEDAGEEERRRRTPTTDNRRPRHREGEERHDKGQGGPRHSLTTKSLEVRGSSRYGPAFKTGIKPWWGGKREREEGRKKGRRGSNLNKTYCKKR